jgi:phosphatidylglycerophosphate synthase
MSFSWTIIILNRFAYFVQQGIFDRVLALVMTGVFAYFYFLDCVDGFIARKYEKVTRLGDVLDHVSDVLGRTMTIISNFK